MSLSTLLEGIDLRLRLSPEFELRVDHFVLNAGNFVVVCGHNGSGKSTLCRILAGKLFADSGWAQIRTEDGRVSPSRLTDLVAYLPARAPLFEDLSACENVVCETEPTRKLLGLRMMDWRRALEETQRDLSRLGQPGVIPSMAVRQLSTGQRSAIVIARALRLNRCFLLLDEADGQLGVSESSVLYSTLRLLADEGAGVVLVSHRPSAAYRLCNGPGRSSERSESWENFYS
jgi:ABC-type sugar transport system ATPase subunit